MLKVSQILKRAMLLLLEFVLSKWHGLCTTADFEGLRAVLLTLEVAGVTLKCRKHFFYLHSGLEIWIREKIWVVVDINLVKKNTEPNSRTLRSKEVSVKKYEILGLKKILNVPFSNIDISLQLFFFSFCNTLN